MSSPEERPWWHRDRHADRRGFLHARGRIKTALRSWFVDSGYTEVEPAALQISPGNEAHLHAFSTDFVDETGARRRYHLHTSPELAMKKLLAAGETRIFAFAPVYRNGERGPLHSPEFTMLEWYEVGAPYTHIMDQCGEMLRVAARESGTTSWRRGKRTIDPFAAPERLTVAEALARHAGVDLLSTLHSGDANKNALAVQLNSNGIRVAPDDTWSDLFSRVLVERVEPAIGDARATILTEYPSVEAALARRTPHDPRVAERFELYACGVELANCFGELTDPIEQRRRFEAEMDEKERIYGVRYPIDEDFLAALAQMPPTSGGALGFDRLVMLATGADRIDQVLWTPVA